MAFMLVRHKVKDFAQFKPKFDEHGAWRKTAGSRGARLFRNAHDPNEVVALIEWDDLNKAQAFAESPELRDKMAAAGVSDKPDIYFLEETDKQPA